MDPSFEQLYELEIHELHPRAASVRYPVEDEPDEEEVREAIEKTRKTLEFVNRKLCLKQSN